MPGVLIVIILCGTIVLCVGIITRRRTRLWQMQQEAQTRLFNHMVDRFGSAEEFTDYVASEEGQEFLDDLASEQDRYPGKPVSVATMFRRGVVLAVMGTGTAVWGLIVDQSFIFISGLMMNVIGLGFGISAIILHRRIDRMQAMAPESYEPGMRD